MPFICITKTKINKFKCCGSYAFSYTYPKHVYAKAALSYNIGLNYKNTENTISLRSILLCFQLLLAKYKLAVINKTKFKARFFEIKFKFLLLCFVKEKFVHIANPH